MHELSGCAEVVERELVVVEAALVEERAEVVEVLRTTVVGLVVALLTLEELDEAGAEPEEPPGLTTEVVTSPLSMYTPEKFQSSVEPSLVKRRTPRCQSAPLESVEAETGPASFFKSSAPVEW